MRASLLFVVAGVCCCALALTGCGRSKPEDPAVATAGSDSADVGSPDVSQEPAGVPQEPAPPGEADPTPSYEEPTPAEDPDTEGDAYDPAYMQSTESPSADDQPADGADPTYSSEGRTPGDSADDYSSETPYMEDATSIPGPGYDGGPSSEDGYMPHSDEHAPGAGEYAPRGAQTREATYADLAQQAFRQGDDAAAIRYLHAHAVTADAASAKELLDKMGFNAQLGRPALAVRWGVGVDYHGPPAQSGKVFPIGTLQELPTRTPTRGAASEAAGSDVAPTNGMGTGRGSQGTDPVLQAFTGELGRRVVEQLKLRLDRGDFGEVLKTAAAQPAGGAAPYGGAAYSGGAPGGYMDEGHGGATSGYGAMPQDPRGRDKALRSMAPGLTGLPVASTKELMAAARQAGLDALVVFRVQVSIRPRTTHVFNDTDIYLYDVAKGVELHRTRRPLKNVEIQVQRASGEEDGVDKTLIELFQKIDHTWKVGPLPELAPERVLDRIRGLLSEKTPEKLLPVLAEIRMYHTRGMLQDDHLLIACKHLLGDEIGTQLASGSEEEKKQIVQSWLAPPAPKRGSGDILEKAGT